MGQLRVKEIEEIIRKGVPGARSDGQGLTLTLSVKGTATWVLRYRYAGKPREVTLGRYPELSLADARLEAAEQRKLLLDGKDPAHEKRLARTALVTGLTISELFEDFLSRRAKELRPRTLKSHRQLFDKDVARAIGSRLASDVSPEEIVALTRGIAERSYSVAKRVWENLSVLFGYGVAIGAFKRSPMADLSPRSVLGKAPPRKKRIKLSLVELMTVCAELPNLGTVNRLAILILLATCVRKTELLRADWSEVDLTGGRWLIPEDREGNKAARVYVVPLAPQVVDWFQQLQSISGATGPVLPPQATNSRRVSNHMSRSTLNAALNRLPESVRRFSPHDLRSTARSYLRDLGTRDDTIARALNHSLGGLDEIYQAGDLFEERRAALASWAQLISDAHLGKAFESSVLPPLLRSSALQVSAVHPRLQ